MQNFPNTATVFIKALRAVILGWAIAMLLGWGVLARFNNASVASFLLISLGSGLIAILAMLPGVLAQIGQGDALSTKNNDEPEKRASQEDSRRDSFGYTLGSREQTWAEFGRFTVAWGTAMLIRLLGTVALFVYCRYQLAQSPDWLAIALLGWYVYLTTIEIGTIGWFMNLSRQ